MGSFFLRGRQFAAGGLFYLLHHIRYAIRLFLSSFPTAARCRSTASRTMPAIRTYTQRADIHDGALFRRIWKGGNRVSDYRISINGARHAIQAVTRSAGIDGISGHSARVGSAQDLVKQGATLPDLMQVGRWEDEKMPARYSKALSAEDNAIMRFKYRK